MKLIYRPEIDGLRAIAVGAVIFYHAQIKIFTGGFIGVDIFFVISGYLITSIILKELVTTGHFSFKHFYERRVRRIIPALLTVMLTSLSLAWIYLFPINLIDLSKSILYSLGFISNFYFHYSGQIYGAESGLLKPFLHTWSLSIEEQYYFFFPIILLVTFKYFRKYLIHILILGFIISLGLAEWGSRHHPSFNFYVLPTRGWELLAGSILAYLEIMLGHRSKNKTLNLILPSIGLLLIGHSIFFFDHTIYHPSLYTLLPITGSCLIIWYSDKDEIITKILSTKLFVGVGLISYSLYLWHYPIFAFNNYNHGLENYSKIKSLIIIFILSIITYFIIEKPFRKKIIKFKSLFFFISILFLIISNIQIILNDGYKNRFSNLNTGNYEFLKIQDLKDEEIFFQNFNYNNYSDKKNILIIGNSHGQDLLRVLNFTKLNDKIYFNIPIRDNNNFQIEDLYDFLKKNEKKLNKKHNTLKLDHLIKQYERTDLILFATSYTSEDLNILSDLIRLINQDKKKIIIFNNALHQTTNHQKEFNRLDYFVFKNKRFPNFKEKQEIEKNMFLDLKNKVKVNLKIEEIAMKNNIPLIKREKIFCNFDIKSCPSLTNKGYKIYYDYGHLTKKGAEFFARKIEKDELFLKYLNSTLDISYN